MRSKLSELARTAPTCSYDIISLVETNLAHHVDDNELGLIGYTIFRCDRTELTSNKSSGGGVIVAVSNSIPCFEISANSRDLEYLFIACKFPSLNMLIGNVYIPPGQPSSVYCKYLNAVDEVLNSSVEYNEIVLMGDFNLPEVDWANADYSVTTNTSARYLLELCATYNLKQLNNVLNFRGVCLDLVFSSFHSCLIVGAEDYALLEEDRNHPSLLFDLEIHTDPPAYNQKTILNFRKCDHMSIFRALQDLSYPTSQEILQPELFFNSFCMSLGEIIKHHTPVKKIRQTPVFPVWFSAELKQLVISKKLLHKRYKMSLSNTDLEHFRAARRECNKLSRLCYSVYLKRVEDSISSNINAFWSHVNSRKGSSEVPSRMSYDSSEASDSSGKCELFAQYFASVFTQDISSPPTYDFGLNISISNCCVTAPDIQRRLEALDPKKSAGPDDIPPIILKYCAPVLAPHLAIYFKALLAAGIFPSSLKISYVIPIFKSGDKENVRNYRPIAIQPTLAKIFEGIVLDSLYFQLCRHICLEQHGFMRGRSTTTNLLVFQEFVMAAFADSSQVDCIYLDFSKAFDKISHGLLIAKLEGYGICGPLLRWLRSYLNDRTLVVKYEGSTSRPFPVLSGVPQGSHLGPTLFLLFINDIRSAISLKFLLFADDAKIFNRINSPQDQEELQHTLDSIVSWCTTNSMEINVAKCFVMSFLRRSNKMTFDYCIEGLSVKTVDKIKDLGVFMTPTLSPHEHLIHVAARASSTMGFILRQSKDFKSPQTLVTLYKTLVRPLLEYSSVIWSPYQYGHVEILNRVQTRFIRMLGVRLGYGFLETPVTTVESQFGLHKLHIRRKYMDLLFLFRLVGGCMDCPLLLSDLDFSIPTATRSRAVFTRRFQPTNYAFNHGMTRLIRTGCELSELDFFTSSLASFKAKALQLLTS